MKTTIKILSLLLALIFVLPVFTACEPAEQSGGKQMVTIQWVQGQKVLKEEIVEKGTTLTEWTPEGSGEFQGWYERPYIKRFDFSKPVTKSMKIYASFKGGAEGGTEEFVMPDWYLIGAGKGDLDKANNWNHEAAATNLGLYAGEDGIYKITLSLYEGDQFKMTKDLDWAGEMAIDKMAGYADGVVKDETGKVVFTAGENNNFVVAEGCDGKYEITYDPDTMLMGFKFIEALEKIPDDIRLIGEFNGWSESYGEDDYKFVSSDGVNWTYEWEVTSSTTFKVFNALSSNYYPGGTGNDLTIDAGKYTVTFNSKTRDIVVTDENGNEVDVGFTNSGSDDNGGTTVTPNADPVEEFYVVLDSIWNDGSLMGVWAWATNVDGDWYDIVATDDANVYKVTLSAGIGLMTLVDFNAGTETEDWSAMRTQTADMAVPDKSDDKIYYHVSNGTWSNSSENPGSTGDSTANNDPLTESVTVYFENNWLWTNVSCHYWGEEGFVGTEYPGTAMTAVGTLNGHDVYSIELPVGVTGFIFTGNKDTEPHDLDQSPDIGTSALSNGNAWRMAWVDANTVESFNYDPNATEEPAETDAYYLVGYLNSADYAGTDYKFVDGKLTVKFNSGSHYVYIKTGAGQNLMTQTYVSGSKGTFVSGGNEKMLVPGGVDVTFTLVVNDDGSVTVSYEVVDLAEHVYTVAGSSTEFLGTAWAAELAANDLVYDSTTGLFTKSFTNNTSAAIEFAFKIVTDHKWDVNYGASNVVENGVEVTTNSDGNAIVVVPAGKTLTIAFNGQNKNIILTIE